MGGSPASRKVSWKGKLRRVLAAPFRFLLKDELQKLAEAEAELEQLKQKLHGAEARLQGLADEVAGERSIRQRDLDDLRQAYLQTRSEFEEVRDRRLPRLGTDFAGFQAGFEALQREVERLRDERAVGLEKALGGLQAAFDQLQHELLNVRDGRLPALEQAQASLQEAHDRLQGEVEHLRDGRLPELTGTLAALHAAIEAVQKLAEEIRDQRLPAASARLDALIERLFEEMTVTRSLVDRILYDEPLEVRVLDQGVEEELPEAVRRAWSRFLALHRGSREEILERAGEYVEVFVGCDPVLDLGCGRGELLEALTRAGIEALGVDSDPAAVAECRQRGLKADVQDALEALAAQPAGSLGGVACVHLVEHLPAARWMQLFQEAARALRPGGILAVESPNPETLRVGAGLFWVDPTHLRPVHPEAARFVAEAVGFEVMEVRKLRPFPETQALAYRASSEGERRAWQHLDEWLSGCRDYLLIARKPLPGPGETHAEG